MTLVCFGCNLMNWFPLILMCITCLSPSYRRRKKYIRRNGLKNIALPGTVVVCFCVYVLLFNKESSFLKLPVPCTYSFVQLNLKLTSKNSSNMVFIYYYIIDRSETSSFISIFCVFFMGV